MNTTSTSGYASPHTASLIAMGSYVVYLTSLLTEISLDLYYKKQRYIFKDTISSICNGLLSQVFGFFLKFISLLPYTYIQTNYGLFTFEATVLNSIIILVMMDLGYYIAHRAAHDINLIWSGHIPHHSSEQYNFSTAVRQGTFEAPLCGAAYWFVALAGVPFDVARLHFQFDLVFQFFVHTKFIDRLPAPIEFIFNTPSHHRVHHGTNPKYIDKNYGGILCIWDRMFGTFQEEEETVVYGIVRPLKSWSPLYSNFQYFYDVLRFSYARYRKTSLASALNFMFRHPGWQPGQTKETKMIQLEQFWEKRKDFKLDPDRVLSGVHKAFLITQTGFMIGALFVLTSPVLDITSRFTLTSMMIWGMYSVGRVMDDNGIASYTTEILRLATTSVVLYSMSSVATFVFILVTGGLLSQSFLVEVSEASSVKSE